MGVVIHNDCSVGRIRRAPLRDSPAWVCGVLVTTSWVFSHLVNQGRRTEDALSVQRIVGDEYLPGEERSIESLANGQSSVSSGQRSSAGSSIRCSTQPVSSKSTGMISNSSEMSWYSSRLKPDRN